LRANPFEEGGDDGIHPSHAKYFQEELESYMQGEAKLYLIGHFGVSLVD